MLGVENPSRARAMKKYGVPQMIPTVRKRNRPRADTRPA